MIYLIQLNIPITVSDTLNGVCKCRSVGARGFVLLNFLYGHTVNVEIYIYNGGPITSKGGI